MERRYRIIAALIGVIILLIILMVTQPPKIKAIEVVKEIEVEKETIVTVEKEPSYTYNISSVEREMMARLIYLEANTESIECQQAIASVVINRWLDGRWGPTITSVIYSPYQFSPAELIQQTTPTETNYEAVDYVLKNGATMPAYVMFFRANYHFDWDGYIEHCQLDDVCFGYFLTPYLHLQDYYLHQITLLLQYIEILNYEVYVGYSIQRLLPIDSIVDEPFRIVLFLLPTTACQSLLMAQASPI